MDNERDVSMEELFDVLAMVVEALEEHRVTYALIGGMATSYRSQPRFTKDVDFLLQIPQVTLPGLLDTLAAQNYRFDQLAVIREWIQHHMVVLTYRGVRIDWLKAIIPAYQHILERATDETWAGRRIRVASSEGLILMKLAAARTQDWLDIENLAAAEGARLDVDWIREEWKTMSQPDDPRMAKFLDLVARVREMEN